MKRERKIQEEGEREKGVCSFVYHHTIVDILHKHRIIIRRKHYSLFHDRAPVQKKAQHNENMLIINLFCKRDYRLRY